MTAANDGYFKIARVSRNDLEQAGFDVSNVDDATMERLAGNLGYSYVANSFWIDLPILADDLGIPRRDSNPERNDR